MDSTHNDLELTPGKGCVDFGKFSSALDKVGYSGEVSLEFEYRDVALDDIENEIRSGVNHLKKSGWQVDAMV